jgi:branched-chain amino acid transport system ATP-binding protein
MNPTSAIKTSNLAKSFGDNLAVSNLNLDIRKGELYGLVGPDGAGKSTTMRSIMGLTPPKQGTITFNGQDITGRKAYLLVRDGIAYVPDDRRVFADLTVDDNLEIPFSRNSEWTRERVYDLFPSLGEMKSRRAGNLSGGEQQMLTVARALMTGPELLLLDEPTEGLAPLIVRDLEDQILRLRDAGISILLSEQNVKSALNLVNRVYVIDNGRIRFEGTVADLEANEEIKKKYLMV